MLAMPFFTVLAVWQFYLFVTFKNVDGTGNGGYLHLFIAVFVALLACVTSFFVFTVLMRRDPEDELHITSRQ